MKNESKINCPNCGTEINVNDILKHQIEEGLLKDLQKERAEIIASQNTIKDQLEKERKEFEAKKKRENELFQDRLDRQTKDAKVEIEAKLKRKLEEEKKDQLNALEKELNEKSEKLKDLYKKDAEISKLQREKSEIKEAVEAEAAKRLHQQLIVEMEKVKKQAADSNELKLKELQKQLDDQKELTQEMKRKQEQGSMQLQGEVQELAIEEWLASQFPLDTIEEIKKGATGADCLQIVNTREHQNCGTIYFESKRTKAFQPAWIEKFKNDIRDKNANVGVLVTEVLPKDMDRMGLKEGVWICTFEEFKGLTAVLRQHIIKINTALISQENKGDKMAMLYDFLTSNEFKLQMEGIVEGFTQMQTDLNKEKNAMKRLWKQREKQIDKVINNTIHMYGSLKGIAGGAVPSIKLLELDDVDDLNLDE